MSNMPDPILSSFEFVKTYYHGVTIFSSIIKCDLLPQFPLKFVCSYPLEYKLFNFVNRNMHMCTFCSCILTILCEKKKELAALHVCRSTECNDLSYLM